MVRWWRRWGKRKRRRAGSSVEMDRESLERAFRRLGEIAEEIAASGRTRAEEKLERFNGEWQGSVDPVFTEFAY